MNRKMLMQFTKDFFAAELSITYKLLYVTVLKCYGLHVILIGRIRLATQVSQ